MAPLLLPAFRFEISLVRSIVIAAGSQRLPGSGDSDAEPPDIGNPEAAPPAGEGPC